MSLLMLWDLDERILITHIGDNSLFLCSDKSAYKLTEDHLLSKLFLKKGFFNEETDLPEDFNIPYRYLGGSPVVEVDCLILEVGTNDTLLSFNSEIGNTINEDSTINEDFLNDLKFGCAQLIRFTKQSTVNPNVMGCREILAKLSLFKDMSYAQIHRFFSSMKILDFEDAEFLRSSNPKGLYIILEGALKLGSNVFFTKDCLFEESLFKIVNIYDEISIVQPGKVAYLSRFELNKLMVQQPRTANRFLKNFIRDML